MTITVRAKAPGYYGGIIREPGPDERFEIAREEDFAASWMVRVKPRRLTIDELVAAPEPKKAAADAV